MWQNIKQLEPHFFRSSSNSQESFNLLINRRKKGLDEEHKRVLRIDRVKKRLRNARKLEEIDREDDTVININGSYT